MNGPLRCQKEFYYFTWKSYNMYFILMQWDLLLLTYLNVLLHKWQVKGFSSSWDLSWRSKAQTILKPVYKQQENRIAYGTVENGYFGKIKTKWSILDWDKSKYQKLLPLCKSIYVSLSLVWFLGIQALSLHCPQLCRQQQQLSHLNGRLVIAQLISCAKK